MTSAILPRAMMDILLQTYDTFKIIQTNKYLATNSLSLSDALFLFSVLKTPTSLAGFSNVTNDICDEEKIRNPQKQHQFRVSRISLRIKKRTFLSLLSLLDVVVSVVFILLVRRDESAFLETSVVVVLVFLFFFFFFFFFLLFLLLFRNNNIIVFGKNRTRKTTAETTRTKNGRDE